MDQTQSFHQLHQTQINVGITSQDNKEKSSFPTFNRESNQQDGQTSRNQTVISKQRAILNGINDIFETGQQGESPQQIQLHQLLTNKFSQKKTNNNLVMRTVKDQGASQDLEDDYLRISQRKLKSRSFMVFHPNNCFIILVNQITLVISLIYFVRFPIVICFENNFEDNNLKYVSLAVYLLQIAVKFNKGYFNDEGLVTDRKKIVKNYLPFKFLVDVLIIIAIYFQTIRYLQAIFVLDIINCVDIIKDFNQIYHLQQKFPITYQLSKLILQIILLAHYIACGLHYFQIHYREEEEQEEVESYLELSYKAQYLQSLYSTVIAMMTGGFNDINAETSEFKIYIILVCIISIMLFGFTMNMIHQILEDLANEAAEFKDVKFKVEQYMQTRNISKDLQLKVIKSMIVRNQEEQSGVFQMLDDNIIAKIPKKMVDEIRAEFFGRIIDQSQFLHQFSSEFLYELQYHMLEMIAKPGDIIYNQGEVVDKLMFLNRGLIQLYKLDHQKNKVNIAQIKENNYFGLDQFLTKNTYEETGEAVKTCQIIYISYDQFLAIVKKYSKDYELFCEHRDITMQRKIKTNATCFICYQETHETKNCPVVTYVPAYKSIYKRLVTSFEVKKRQKYLRRIKRANSLDVKHIIQSCVRQYKLHMLVKARPDFQDVIKQFIDEVSICLDDQQFQISTGLLTYKKNEQEEEEITFNDNVDVIEQEILIELQKQQDDKLKDLPHDRKLSEISDDSYESIDSSQLEEHNGVMKFLASNTKCGYKIIITPAVDSLQNKNKSQQSILDQIGKEQETTLSKQFNQDNVVTLHPHKHCSSNCQCFKDITFMKDHNFFDKPTCVEDIAQSRNCLFPSANFLQIRQQQLEMLNTMKQKEKQNKNLSSAIFIPIRKLAQLEKPNQILEEKSQLQKLIDDQMQPLESPLDIDKSLMSYHRADFTSEQKQQGPKIPEKKFSTFLIIELDKVKIWKQYLTYNNIDQIIRCLRNIGQKALFIKKGLQLNQQLMSANFKMTQKKYDRKKSKLFSLTQFRTKQLNSSTGANTTSIIK